MIVIHPGFSWFFWNVFIYVAPVLLIGCLLETEEGASFLFGLFNKIVTFFDKVIDKLLNK